MIEIAKAIVWFMAIHFNIKLNSSLSHSPNIREQFIFTVFKYKYKALAHLWIIFMLYLSHNDDVNVMDTEIGPKLFLITVKTL